MARKPVATDILGLGMPTYAGTPSPQSDVSASGQPAPTMQPAPSMPVLPTLSGDTPLVRGGLIGIPNIPAPAAPPVPDLTAFTTGLLDRLGARRQDATPAAPSAEDAAYAELQRKKQLQAALTDRGVTDPAYFGGKEAHGTADVAAMPTIASFGHGDDAVKKASAAAYDAIAPGATYQEIHYVNGHPIPTGNVKRKMSASYDHSHADPVVQGSGLGDKFNAVGDQLAAMGRAGLQIPLGIAAAAGIGGDAAKRNAGALLDDLGAARRDSGLGTLVGGLGGGIGGALAGGAAGSAVAGPVGGAVGGALGGLGIQSAGEAMARGILAGHEGAENLGEGALGGALGTGVGAITGGLGGSVARGAASALGRAGARDAADFISALGENSPRAVNAGVGAAALPAANTAAQGVANTIDPDAFEAPDTSATSLLMQAGLGAFAGAIHPLGTDTASGGAPGEDIPPGSIPPEDTPGNPPGDPGMGAASGEAAPGAEVRAGDRPTATGMAVPPLEGEIENTPRSQLPYSPEPIDADFSEIMGLRRPDQLPSRVAEPVEGQPEYRTPGPYTGRPVQDGAYDVYSSGALAAPRDLLGLTRQLPAPDGSAPPSLLSLPRPSGPPSPTDLLASLGQQSPDTPSAASGSPDAGVGPAALPETPEAPAVAQTPPPVAGTDGMLPEGEPEQPTQSGAEIQQRVQQMEATYPQAAQRIYGARTAAGAAPEGLHPMRPLQDVHPRALTAMLQHPDASIRHVARLEKALRSPAYARLHPELKMAARSLRLMPRRTLEAMAREGRQEGTLPFDEGLQAHTQVLGAHAEEELARRDSLSPSEAEADAVENERATFRDCQE